MDTQKSKLCEAVKKEVDKSVNEIEKFIKNSVFDPIILEIIDEEFSIIYEQGINGYKRKKGELAASPEERYYFIELEEFCSTYGFDIKSFPTISYSSSLMDESDQNDPNNIDNFLNGSNMVAYEVYLGNKEIMRAWKTIYNKHKNKYAIRDAEFDKPSKILNSFGIMMHPEIAKVSDDLFINHHYAEAVSEAVKKLVNYVKEKSDSSEDGYRLMQKVFDSKSPILKFNSLKKKSDIDVQEGYKHLFMGVVLGIRNPRAHENIVDEHEDALECIAFISFLAKRLDKAIK